MARKVYRERLQHPAVSRRGHIMYKKIAISRPAMSASAAGTIVALLTTSEHAIVQAFQPTFLAPTTRSMPLTAAFVSPIVHPTTMRYGPGLWDPEYEADSFYYGPGRIQSRRDNRLGTRILSPLDILQDPGLRITDPEVIDTEDSYQLAFSLPNKVEQDDFDVSVSGSLLTVKARVTRETSGNDTGRRGGGWVTRSSRTDSVSRFFVLPEGVSGSGVKTTWASDCQVLQVEFIKGTNPNNTPLKATDEIGRGTAMAATSKADTSSSSSTQKDLATESNTESMASSRPVATDSEVDAAARSEPTTKLPQSPESRPDSERPSRPRSSMFDALDEEFVELANAFWGQEALQFPTREEMVSRAKVAREARAKRATAMRRATMAVDVSETTDGPYLVRVALPEGTTRNDVSLSALPEKAALRVTFSPDGRRPAYKDVRLPKNALLSNVSAKFDTEHETSSEGGELSKGGRVSSLQITVGKATPTEPKLIDIM